VNPASAASVTVIGWLLSVTVNVADVCGLAVAVFSVWAGMPFVPVNENVPVLFTDCFFVTTLVSGMLTASSIPSPVAPLLLSAQVIENVTEVIPVPVSKTEPHAVPSGVVVHSAPAAALVVARRNELPANTNCPLRPANNEGVTAPPVDVEPAKVHTDVASAVPMVPPSRSI
jgi:hypothetical protein